MFTASKLLWNSWLLVISAWQLYPWHHVFTASSLHDCCLHTHVPPTCNAPYVYYFLVYVKMTRIKMTTPKDNPKNVTVNFSAFAFSCADTTAL